MPKCEAKYEFDMTKHMKMSNMEKHNLAKLEEYEKYEWFIESS